MSASRLPQFALIVSLSLVSCSRSADRATSTTVKGVPAGTSSVADAQSSVQAKLATLVGSYQWNVETKTYVFTDKQTIEAIVGSATDQIVHDLVTCLDDKRPSLVTLKGAPVSLGIVCYEALTQIVYYEPPGPQGDIASQWPGHIEPTATPDQLAEAKRAWTEVVRKKAYRRL